MSTPLVTVGIPTYNRPESLRRTLECITKQTYTNLEIIVSDNCTPGDAGEQITAIMQNFMQKDSRIQFYRQEENKGVVYNFSFVLEKATANYFMWAADDDMWGSSDLLTYLMRYAPDHALTFPEAYYINSQVPILSYYEKCETNWDFVQEFCKNGAGYPFYGVYNIDLLKRYNIQFEFDTDLPYYGEGTFLHKLFITAPVKFVSKASILYTPCGSIPPLELQIDLFIKYYYRALQLYSDSNLPLYQKTTVVHLISENYGAHLQDLFAKLPSEQKTSILSSSCRVSIRKINALKKKYKASIKKHLKDISPCTSVVAASTKRMSPDTDFLHEFQHAFSKKHQMLTDNNRFTCTWEDRWPCLEDATTATGFDAHYLYHTAWAARVLADTKPQLHVDIGSCLRFVSLVSAFVPVQFYDYRPAKIRLSNFDSGYADITQLPFEDNSIASLSCMYVVEHIGLERYGDPFDPKGDLKAMAELQRVLAPGGSLLFVVPVGEKARIQYNAHRIYEPNQIIAAFDSLELNSFSLVMDNGDVLENTPICHVCSQCYACGCFHFIKTGINGRNKS